MLRPLVGMSPFEFLERAGNYGVPLAMLLCSAPAATFRDWFEPLSHRIVASRIELVAWTLRLSVFFLLAGHGVLALHQTPLLLSHMAWLGFAHPEIATLLERGLRAGAGDGDLDSAASRAVARRVGLEARLGVAFPVFRRLGL